MKRMMAWVVAGLAAVLGVGMGAAAAAPGGKEVVMDQKDTSRVVRRAVGAGRWFPGNPRQLKAMVEGFLADAHPPAVTGRIVGAISPHAGYAYSGKVAGYTFRAIQENSRASGAPDVVVILGFSHRESFRGVVLMDGDAIATPMGETALDVAAGSVLTGSSARIRFDYRPHDGEHSAENQIPFVQAALPGIPLVVGLLGEHDSQTMAELVAALGVLSAGHKILVVASTDLLHDADYALVSRTDRETLKVIGALDADELAKGWSYERQTCCGVGPVLAVMCYAGKAGCRQGVVLHYRNSGDDFPESRGQWVVGYGAVVFVMDAAVDQKESKK